MKKLVVAVLISLAVTACATAPKEKAPQAASPEAASSKPKAEAAPQPTAVTPPIHVESESEKLAAQLQNLAKKSVYFDFDAFVVKPEYHDVIQQQADFIKAHQDETVVLDGNADERGSNEYNLALGDRRADAVRKNLELLGVAAGKISVVSFGEEKPRLACHEEKCWQENRRVDFVHKLNP
ncbi:MAG: peptidoglycan-associated lipoprotein Pal [Nitrosomonadales bacterium]|nr:peptidoglycan-associated lipoprotein Pal [Nitrosomonadales bacterium]